MRTAIYVISDGTGETARRIINSALTQFENYQVEPKIWTNITSQKIAKKIVKEASTKDGIIFYTIINEKIHKMIRDESRKLRVPIVDLLEASLNALHKKFGHKPSGIPYRYKQDQKDHFKRMTATEFTFDHDDGENLKGIKDADVVLVGVSRSSKTSTAFYLGYCGIKVANVPIHYSLDIPEELRKANNNKVVALKIELFRLRSARETRARNLEFKPFDPYTNDKEMTKELRYLNKLTKQHKWKQVNVTSDAIEEIAWEIQQVVKLDPIAFPA